MLTLAQGLAGRGASVDVVVSRAEGPYLARVGSGLRVTSLEARTTRASIPKLIRFVQRRRPEVLISALDHLNIAAIVAKRVSGVRSRVVVTTHTMVSIATRASQETRLRLIPPLMRFFYPSADSIVAVSKAVAQDLAAITGLPLQSIDVIYNPVPIDEISRMAKESVASSWFEADSPPVVVTVGSLRKHKDQRTLIEAIALLKRTTAVRLVILGEGPERAALSGLLTDLGLRDDVFMPGFVANPYAWLSRAALFVLPSRWEGLPTALIEAMACGISPIATDCPGGSAEVLENGKYGRLTPVGDPASLAEAILRTIDQPFSPQNLKNRASTFSVEIAVEKYINLIDEIAG